MILALALGCVTLPESIPNQQGTVSEDVAGTLLSIASPDLPIVPWITLSQLGNEDFRSCPKVYADASIVADGYDCVDASGITWSGTASGTNNGVHSVITMSNFGPTGIEGGWIGNGTIDIDSTSGGYVLKTRMQLDSWDGEPQTWWIDTEMGLGVSDSRYYAEHYDGTIGLQDWGLATVSGNNVTLAITLGCGYADHGAGTMSVGGKNEAFYTFDSIALGGPPGPSLDSGGGDTGSTVYTRDTGDTGGGGGGSGGGTIPGLDLTQADDLCGVCTTVTIDGEPVGSCVSPARSVAFPFPPVY